MISEIKNIIRERCNLFQKKKDKSNEVSFRTSDFHNDMSNRCNRTHLLFRVLLEERENGT